MASDGAQAPGYLRSQNGEIVHKTGCPKTGRAVLWTWANDRFCTDVDLVANLPYWIRPCKYCFQSVKPPEPVNVAQLRRRVRDSRAYFTRTAVHQTGLIVSQEDARLIGEERIQYNRVKTEFPEFWP